MSRKILQLVSVFALSSFVATAQTTTQSPNDRLTALEEQVADLKLRMAGVESQVIKTTEENAYLRNALKVGKPIQEITLPNKIKVILTSLIGDKNTGIVTANLVFVNEDVEFQTIQYLVLEGYLSLIDIEGNVFQNSKQKIGLSEREELLPNVPLKGFVSYKNIPNTVKIARIVAIRVFDSKTQEYPIIFRNIDINWQ